MLVACCGLFKEAFVVLHVFTNDLLAGLVRSDIVEAKFNVADEDLADRVDLFLGHFEEEWVQDRLVIAEYGLFKHFAFLLR